MEEIIEEPSLDASLCSFHSPNSETIKYYYKLKYPNTYSLPRRKILDILENKQVYSGLKQSVSSYINRVRKADAGPSIEDLSSPNEAQMDEDISIVFDNTSNTNELSMNRRGSCSEKISVLPELVLPPEFSMYDSVHSLNVPVNGCIEKANISKVVIDDASMCSAVVEVPYSTGLVLKRLEKPVHSAVSKKISGARRPRFGRKSVIPLRGIQAKSTQTIFTNEK